MGSISLCDIEWWETRVQQRVKITLLSEIALKIMHSSLSFLFSTANLQVTVLIYDMKIFVSLASWVYRAGLNPNFTAVLFPADVSIHSKFLWTTVQVEKCLTIACDLSHMHGSGDVTVHQASMSVAGCTRVSSWVGPVKLVTALLSSGRAECHGVNQSKL